MGNIVSRRSFNKSIALALGAAAVPAFGAGRPRNLKIGYSTLAWDVSPKDPATFEDSVKDISNLGFWGFETVSPILEAYDTNGLLPKLIEANHVPFKAGYVGVNVTDLSVRKENIEKLVRVGKIIQKYGGTFAVIQVNSRKQVLGNGQGPDSFVFKDYFQKIVSGLNDYGAALADIGLRSGLHQHTGTVVETKDEVYAVMEAVNTKVVKFAPDVGQLQKGGSDAAKVVKDFASITEHMHLKDYSGGKYFVGYCPLGMGVVDIESILNTLEETGHNPDVMVELDRPADTPMSALETAVFSKAYLVKLGYSFRN
jgi:inosose dehydratase